MIKEYLLSSSQLWDDINNDFGKVGGVYILKCYSSSERSSYIEVPRFVDTDKAGILYIGKTDGFLDRVIELTKSISPGYKSSAHACGYRYKNNQKTMDNFPYENLCLELNNISDARTEESKLLGQYEIKFGELPPLNRSS